jgi:hypothetical protein
MEKQNNTYSQFQRLTLSDTNDEMHFRIFLTVSISTPMLCLTKANRFDWRDPVQFNDGTAPIALRALQPAGTTHQ